MSMMQWSSICIHRIYEGLQSRRLAYRNISQIKQLPVFPGSGKETIVNSKRKGKEGELELSKLLRAYGFPGCRRSQQYCGISGDADVIGLPGIHIECKRVEKLDLEKALVQSETEAKKGEIPVVMHRVSRKPWMVSMRLEHFRRISGDFSLCEFEWLSYEKGTVTILLNDWIRRYKEYAGGA